MEQHGSPADPSHQGAGLVHPLLRTVLLPRELLRKRGTEIKARIGILIPYRSLKAYEKPNDLREYLRFRTSLLALAFRKGNVLIRLPVRPLLPKESAEAKGRLLSRLPAKAVLHNGPRDSRWLHLPTHGKSPEEESVLFPDGSQGPSNRAGR